MSRTKLIQFFATPADLEPGIRSIESKQRLALAEQNYYESKSIQTIGSLFSIPNLGKVTDRRSPRYVVQPTAKNFHPARVVQVGKKKDFPPKLAMALALIGIQPPGGKVVYRSSGDIKPLDVRRAIVEQLGRTYANRPQNSHTVKTSSTRQRTSR